MKVYLKTLITNILLKWYRTLVMRTSGPTVTKYFDRPVIIAIEYILYRDLSTRQALMHIVRNKFFYKTAVIACSILAVMFLLGYSTSIAVIDKIQVEKEMSEYKLKQSLNQLFDIKSNNDSLSEEINDIIKSKDYLRFQAFHEIGVIIPKSIPHEDLKLMFEEANRYKVPLKIALGVVYQECRFQKDVKASPTGALYYMQVQPQSYSMLAPKIGIRTPQNKQTTIKVGMYLLRYLFDLYKSTGKSDKESWKLTLAAYNAGPGAVDLYHGVPPFQETQNYVNNIMNCNHH